MESNSNIRTGQYSFWQFIQKYKIVIPIIQRDYAQGRYDKHALRKEFFGQLIDAAVNNKQIKLDYVYGTPSDPADLVGGVESECIYPIDGQQRLTSLWLLHWYVAYLCGDKLSDNVVVNILRNFSYQTRKSSREFCENLCEPLKGFSQGTSVGDLIRNQPWFSQRFKEDQTVAAMLRSISDPESGTGFCELLQENNVEADFLWNILTGPDCPIKFFFKNTKDAQVGNPDDLYIKMNARGKKLTEFENFKSELYSFKLGEKYLFRSSGDDFIKIFENDWANIFWRYRKENTSLYDDIMFEFFNRIAFNYLIKNNDNTDAQKEAFVYFNPKSRPEYRSISVYATILTEEFKSQFKALMKGLIKLDKIGIDIEKLLADKPYYFPIFFTYSDPNDSGFQLQTNFAKNIKDEVYYIPKPTVESQALLYAFMRYIILWHKAEEEFNRCFFYDWMMFARNLFSNSNIDTFEDLVAYQKVIDAYSVGCLNIISYLSDNDRILDLRPSSLLSQLDEEIFKARKINELRTIDPNSSIELGLRQAESVKVFSGAVRFLFTDEAGNMGDWTLFEAKKETFLSMIYYSKDSETDVDWSFRAEVSPDVLRTLLYYVEDPQHLNIIGMNSRLETWKWILLDKRLAMPVHKLLKDGVLSEEKLASFKCRIAFDELKFAHEDLVKSRILYQTTWGEQRNTFYFNINKCWLLQYGCSQDAKLYLLGSPRNRLMEEAEKQEPGRKLIWINNRRFLHDNKHLWGRSFLFDFEWNDSPFVFYWNETSMTREPHKKDVYLRRREDKQPYNGDADDENLAIKVDWDCSYEEFEYQLKELISMAKADDSNSELSEYEN